MTDHLLRDFAGYGPTPPDPQWPGGAKLALNFVLNIEECGEPSVPDGDPASEQGLVEAGGDPHQARVACDKFLQQWVNGSFPQADVDETRGQDVTYSVEFPFGARTLELRLGLRDGLFSSCHTAVVDMVVHWIGKRLVHWQQG